MQAEGPTPNEQASVGMGASGLQAATMAHLARPASRAGGMLVAKGACRRHPALALAVGLCPLSSPPTHPPTHPHHPSPLTHPSTYHHMFLLPRQVWGCAIEAAAVAGKPSVAEELLRRMQAAGLTPNVIVWTSLLSAYGATRDLGRAEGVLRQMAEAGCPPNGKTYTELMAQLAAQGTWDRLEEGCVAGACARLACWQHRQVWRPVGVRLNAPTTLAACGPGKTCRRALGVLSCGLSMQGPPGACRCRIVLVWQGLLTPAASMRRVLLQVGTRIASATSGRCSPVGAALSWLGGCPVPLPRSRPHQRLTPPLTAGLHLPPVLPVEPRTPAASPCRGLACRPGQPCHPV